MLLPWAVAALRLADEPPVVAGGPRTAFPGSLAPVPATAHDLTTRQPVAPDEPVRFQIALRLQPDGQVPEVAYAALVRWLREQGLTIEDSGRGVHLMVEARGTAAQVGKVLETRFGRVEIGGRSCVAAVSAPSLPAALSGAVIGINGLQPFLHLNKGPVFAPSASGRPVVP